MNRFHLRLALAAVVFLVLFLGVQQWRWNGAKGAERAHRNFLERVSDRNWSKVHRMIARDYADRWELDREQISLALQDVGGEFIFHLKIGWDTDSLDKAEDGSYLISGTAQIDGRGTPIAEMILTESRRYAAEHFSFRWRHSGLLPWTWRLESADHPSAELPPGYEPGQLRGVAAPF